MTLRTVASLLATLTLLAAVVVVGLVAAPSIALALQEPGGIGAAPEQRHHAIASARPLAASAPLATPSSPPYTGPLIAPTGSRSITRQQLHAWVASRPFFGEDPQNDAVWEQQQWLDIRCMARKGFLHDPTDPLLQDHAVSEADGLTTQQAEAFAVAMDGPPTDAPYDWRTAGCHGRSVHVTGQDDAH